MKKGVPHFFQNPHLERRFLGEMNNDYWLVRSAYEMLEGEKYETNWRIAPVLPRRVQAIEI